MKTSWSASTAAEFDQPNKTVAIKYADREGNLAGGILIEMSSRPRFKVLECTEWIDLEIFPREHVKVWVVQQLERTLVVECNDGELARIVLSDKTCSNMNREWQNVWKRTTETISFDNVKDTATDYYRIVPIKGEMNQYRKN